MSDSSSGNHNRLDEPTRCIELPERVRQAQVDNEGTRITRLPGFGNGARTRRGNTRPPVQLREGPAGPLPARELFTRHFEAIRQACARHSKGVACVALHPRRGVCGSLWLKRGSQLRAGIIGRHEFADLRLTDDPAVSLRHLAILVETPEEQTPVRMRLLDLRTPLGLVGEDGQPLRSVTADGPLFLGVGSYVLFLHPTPASFGGTSAEEAWEQLPPRRILHAEERGDEPAKRKPAVVPDPSPPEQESGSRVDAYRERATSVTSMKPVRPLRLDRPEGPTRYLLTVESFGRHNLIAISDEAARRGVLIGRYERCETHGVPGFSSRNLSRVHALMIESGGDMWWIDTASTNGTLTRNGLVRLEKLAPSTQLQLPDQTIVSCEPTN